jgi:hypothetical protein
VEPRRDARQYGQADLDADRQVANALADGTLGGMLFSAEISDPQAASEAGSDA